MIPRFPIWRFNGLVNIVGLGVALAGCVLVLSYINREWTYNSWIPDADQIYRLQTKFTLPGLEDMYFPFGPGPVKAALEKDFSAEIAAIVRIHAREGSVRRGDTLFPEAIHVVDESFFDVFPLPFVAGNASRALPDVSSVVISEGMARKYFSQDTPLGRTLLIEDGIRKREFVVTGVFRNLPETTTSDLRIDVLTLVNEPEFASQRWLFNYWMGLNNAVFLKLRPGAEIALIEAALPEFEDRNMPPEMNAQTHFDLLPLRNIRLSAGPYDDRESDIATVAVFALVAAMVYAIACINFVNMSTALAAGRIREVAMRKVMGAQRPQLAMQFFGESLLASALALLLGLGLAELAMPFLGAVAAGSFPSAIPVSLWPWLPGLVVLTGLIGGFYPIVHLTRIPPAEALRASGATLAGGGSALRTALVVVQFAIAIALIASAAVVHAQARFARSMERGFDRSNLVVVRNVYRPEALEVARLYKDRAAALPGVVVASLSGGIPSDISGDLTSVRDPHGVSGEEISLRHVSIDPDFLATYGIPLRAGRNLDSAREFDREPDTEGPIRGFSGLLNESAVTRLGFATPADAVGQTIAIRPGYRNEAPVTIIGVVPDIVAEGARHAVEPTLYSWQWSTMGNLTVRYRGTEGGGLMAMLEELWRETVPDVPFHAEYLEQRLVALDAGETARAMLLAASSAFAVAIACVGLFALASFTLLRRRKEIGIRKILGASDGQILKLLIWQYAKPVLAGGGLALPVAWAAMRRWLDGFAYRIELAPGPFLAALLTALVIALLTVATRAAAMSRTHPAEALRQE